ncbi:hypothetical protein DPMN_119278 [Dreissena polymorpha]|uniref:Uncharacterized protein n=1 Tax=Dreissena polymorpha TaxID=45954 RepID=A0A9D4GLL4_DREPO|nr:hypothetical protein DPMN_119278 [Dreissena polymorpha]
MFNTGRSSNDRRCTGNNLSRPRQICDNASVIAGVAPVNVGRVPVKLRYIGKPALCRDATGIHRGSVWALPATIGVKTGRCRNSAGIAPVSAGGVTVYRGFAGTLSAFTGAPPGHYRRQPWLCRGFTGINRS